MKKQALLGALLATACISGAHATEGAIGHQITGLQVMPYAGLIPPTPGWDFQFSYIQYSGQTGAQRVIPIAGLASYGLRANLNFYMVTGTYIWKTDTARWNFASMATIPAMTVGTNANVNIGPYGYRLRQSNSGLYDAFFAPVIAGYHFDQQRHLSLALYVYAPTGKYDKNTLANTGLNVWTFSPTVGYTQLSKDASWEWSSTGVVDFYTKNHATDYQNGAVLRLDTMVLKRFSNGWGIGGVSGLVHQLEGDTHPTVSNFQGNKGRALDLGPMVTYTHHWGIQKIEFSARWLKEFAVKNRLKGDPFLFSANLQL